MRDINGINWRQPTPALALPETQPGGTPTVSFRSPSSVSRRAGSSWGAHWLQLVSDHPSSPDCANPHSIQRQRQAPAVDESRGSAHRYIPGGYRPISKRTTHRRDHIYLLASTKVPNQAHPRKAISAQARGSAAPNKKPDASAKPQRLAAT